MSESFDVVVIGGGPGGYVAAIKCAQLGMKVACVEKRDTLGGTCLNVGCIPSKALLESSEKYVQAMNEFAKHGVKCGSIELDLATMLKRKDEVVANLCGGIAGLFKKNKITYYSGLGVIEEAGKVSVMANNKSEILTAKNIIIATGSEVISLPGVEIDEEKIISSTGALAINAVPKKMIVIGGGYIGLEMGSVWNNLGSEVIVVEYLPKIVPTMDDELGRALHKSLEKQGMQFKLNTKVLSIAKTANGVKLDVEAANGANKETIEADVVLVAIGRKPYTQDLGLDKIGMQLDDKGRIKVDKNFQTNIAGIYAIGDVIAGPMLAHKAEEEGVVVSEIIAGQAGHINYDTIPGVIYTWPEVASVGKTEAQIKESGVAYKIGKFPFLANSRARAVADTEGFVKIIACAKTDKILGAHIIGPHAGTMIAELVLALEYHASSEDIARTSHAHPTLNEAVKEACLAVGGKALHI